MGDTRSIQGLSANLKKSICWISETVKMHPEKSRMEIITTAELRFDLTPRECEFLNTKFNDITEEDCSAQD